MSRAVGAGISVLEGGATADIEDVVVRDGQPQPFDDGFGRGLNVEGGATLTGRRILVERSHEIAVMVSDEGTTARFEDLWVSDTRPRASDGRGGRGLDVQLGAHAVIARAVVEDSVEAGVIMGGATGSSLELTDFVLRRTHPGYDGTGRGFSLRAADLIATRIRIEDQIGVGVFAAGTGTVAFDDARILRTGGLGGPAAARAIAVQPDVRARFTRLVVEDSAQYAVACAGEGAAIELTDARIASTRASDCPSGCLTAGTALAVFDHAAVTARRFAIDTAALCGAHVAGDGALDLSEGDVASCTIGACVQVDGYDVTRLNRDVRYHDNVQNLDTTSLPTPPALSGIEL